MSRGHHIPLRFSMTAPTMGLGNTALPPFRASLRASSMALFSRGGNKPLIQFFYCEPAEYRVYHVLLFKAPLGKDDVGGVGNLLAEGGVYCNPLTNPDRRPCMVSENSVVHIHHTGAGHRWIPAARQRAR